MNIGISDAQKDNMDFVPKVCCVSVRLAVEYPVYPTTIVKHLSWL